LTYNLSDSSMADHERNKTLETANFVKDPPDCQERLRPAPDARVSLHDSGAVLLSVRTGRVFVTNLLGARIWSGIQAGKTVQTIVDEIGSEFKQTRERVRRDADQFVGELRKRELVCADSPVCARRLQWLPVRVLVQLLMYDLQMAFLGFGWIYRQWERSQSRANALRFSAAEEARLFAAFAKASVFYWKPVRCLQRCIVLGRLLRKSGVAARIVVGYRPVPFFSHAWLEIDGRVVNDSPIYAERLAVLDRV
jgi:hypothetical protein